MEIIALFMVLSLAFTFRLLFAAEPSKDNITAQWDIKRQVKKPWISYKLTDCFLKGEFRYPVLIHWVVAKFPKHSWNVAGRIIVFLCDMAQTVVVYMLVKTLLGEHATIHALYAALIFMSTPALLSHNARVKATSGRTFGGLVTTLFFVAVYFVMNYGGWFFTVVALISFLLAVISSTFGMQAIVLLSLVLSVLMLNPTPILLVCVGLLIAYVLPSFFGTRQPLLYFVDHTWWYIRNWKKGTTASYRNTIIDQLLLPYYLLTNRKKASELFRRENSLIIGLYSAPLFFYLVFTYLVDSSVRLAIINTPVLHYFWMVSIASAVLFILTSLQSLLFLGQSERYFEYSAPFFTVLAVIMSVITNILSLEILFSFATFHIIIAMARIKPNMLHQAFGMLDTHQDLGLAYQVLNFLEAKKKNLNVLVVPPKMSGFFSAANPHKKTNLKYYYLQISLPGERHQRYMEEDLEQIRGFKKTPKELKKKYNLDYVIVEKKQFKHNSKNAFIKAIKKVKPSLQNDLYYVAKL